MPRGRPVGTVTFLFTGIDASTRLTSEAPTDHGAALRIHDTIVRGTIERHGGYVFAIRDDGFSAAFSSAADAATAAVESQERLRDDAVVDFPVRMGLHTGDAIPRDQSYVGSEVSRAARLLSLAHGGQVLVSDATEVLLRDRVTLRSLGEHRLRGRHGRMSVYQVVADGLPLDFPVLRSTDDFPGNLPQQLTSLVGREPVVADVAELVRSTSLVTLTGVGGVGKSRLALEVGAEVATEFPDGVWLIELAAIDDPTSIPAALATVLGITPQGDTPLVDTVAETLRGRQALLLVDNCEHLLTEAAAAVDAILASSRTVTILATSREPLGLDGEAAFTVAPLAVDGGESSDAVTLFVDRARAVRHDFGLRESDTATAVTEICAALDGLPLGIELAAARMAAMSATEVRDRLSDRFRLLHRSTAGPERHLTLRHTVEWSYDLLTDDEQCLLRSTSVFAGGFELASVVDVGAARHHDGGDDVELLRHLDSLVRKSLVVADHTAARTRYRQFETIRQFAEDRLAESGALEPTRDRHAAHFARAAVGRWERWDGPGWRDAVDWVELELGNLRAAYQWSLRRDDAIVATDIAAHAALMGFSGQLFETLAWAEAVVPLATVADVPRLPRLGTAAGYACFTGRAVSGREHAHRAAELEDDDRYDPCEHGYASFVEALCSVYCGDLDRYVELTGDVAHRYGRDRGYALAAYVDGLQSCGSDRGSARTHRSVGGGRSFTREPVLDLVRAVDRRYGVRQGRRATRVRRVGRGCGVRARAPRAVLRGVPRARRRSPPHVAR